MLLRLKRKKQQSLHFKEALLSGGVMAFAGLGDTFLYSTLPVFGKEMGFSTLFIGLLLSVNRFIRILVNTTVANTIRKIGMKNTIIICAVFSVLTTMVYGIKTGIVLLLVARIIWGLSYSGLKLTTLNYAALTQKRSALAFGLTQSIKSAGGLFVLWLGPILVNAYGLKNAFFAICALTMICIPLAFSLSQDSKKIMSDKVKVRKTFAPTTINLLIFALSIAIDGILVVTISLLFKSVIADTVQLLTTVAFYLLIKRFFSLGISLIGGILSIKIRIYTLYIISVTACILALLLIAFGFTVTGIVLAFLFNTIIVTFSPFIAIQHDDKAEKSLQIISGISTWWDLGAALGALIGIHLLELLGPQYLFSILSLAILILFINFIKQHGNISSGTIHTTFSLRQKKNQQSGRC